MQNLTWDEGRAPGTLEFKRSGSFCVEGICEEGLTFYILIYQSEETAQIFHLDI